MKHKLIWMMTALSALLPLAGCTQEEEIGLSDRLVTARIETVGDTRVSLDKYGKFSWNTGDKLAVFVGTDYVRDIVVEPSTGRISVNGERSRYAVYPSDAADSGNTGNPTLKVTLPDFYDVTDLVVDDDVTDPYRRIAETWSPMPMVAVNDPKTDVLFFRHVGGLLRIKWVGVPAGTKAVTVTFDQDITGSYAVDLTDTSKPMITSSGSATTANTVVFKVSDSGLAAGKTVFLNVPVPCGHYGTVTLNAFAAASPASTDTPLKTLEYDDSPDFSLVFERHWGRMLITDGTFTYHLEGLEDITVECTGGGPELSHSFVSYRADSEHKMPLPFVLEYSSNPSDATSWTTTAPDWLTMDPNNDYTGSTRGKRLMVNISAQENLAVDQHALDLRNPALHAPKGTSDAPFDLSTIHVATGQTVARSTANCYVVQAPGYYSFPLVYGNTLRNGAYNQKANCTIASTTTSGEVWRYSDYRTYPPLADGEESTAIEKYWAEHASEHPHSYYFIGYFRDHLDKPIVLGKPGEINNVPNSTDYGLYQHFIASRFSGKALTAKIVWTDAPDLVTDVAITGTGTGAYMTFRVPQETICQGNALLAVLVDGVIAWSWHIWVTDYDLTDVETGSNNYKFAPVNIGWCDPKDLQLYPERKIYVRARQTIEDGNASTSDPVLITSKAGRSISAGAHGLYYQWGRKDPLQGGYIQTTVTEDGTTKLPVEKKFYYHADYAAGTKYSVGDWVSLGTAIQHPYLRYLYSGDDPHGGNWTRWWIINLWNSRINGCGPGFSDVKVEKTMYDPSPVGYTVPPRGAYSGFNDSTLLPGTAPDGTPGRYYDEGVFVPEAGYRGGSGISFDYANIWSANMEDLGGDYRNGYALSFTASHVYPLNALSTNIAAPVRPVKDLYF